MTTTIRCVLPSTAAPIYPYQQPDNAAVQVYPERRSNMEGRDEHGQFTRDDTTEAAATRLICQAIRILAEIVSDLAMDAGRRKDAGVTVVHLIAQAERTLDHVDVGRRPATADETEN